MVIFGLIALFGIGCLMIGWGSRQSQVEYLEDKLAEYEDLFATD